MNNNGAIIDMMNKQNLQKKSHLLFFSKLCKHSQELLGTMKQKNLPTKFNWRY